MPRMSPKRLVLTDLKPILVPAGVINGSDKTALPPFKHGTQQMRISLILSSAKSLTIARADGAAAMRDPFVKKPRAFGGKVRTGQRAPSQVNASAIARLDDAFLPACFIKSASRRRN